MERKVLRGKYSGLEKCDIVVVLFNPLLHWHKCRRIRYFDPHGAPAVWALAM